MADYRRIMLAVDLTEESNHVAERAIALAKAFDAELHLVHVIEPLSLAYGGDIPMDLSSVQEQIHDQAKSHLAEFANRLGVPAEHQNLIFGRPESEIHRVAESSGADLIVVGSHGRHGLVTELLQDLLEQGEVASGDTVFCCGPDPMMHAVARLCGEAEMRCYLSLENYMGCGYGVCNGCTVEVQGDRFGGWPYSKTCIEGPVYEACELRSLGHA